VAACTTIAAIGMHLATIHTVNRNYNDNNPGVYVRTDCGLQVGAYYNSYRNLSVYGAYTIDVKPVPVWATVGIITGYPGHTVMPLAMAGVRARVNSYTLRIGYAPKIDGVNRTGIIHFTLERRF